MKRWHDSLAEYLGVILLGGGLMLGPAQEARAQQMLLPESQPTPVAQSPASQSAETENPDHVVVAIVNNRFIVKSQVQRKVDSLLKNERESKEIKDPKEMERFENSFADRIINDWVNTALLSEEAVRRDIRVTNSEVQARLDAMKQDTGLEDAKIRELIDRAGLTPQEVQTEVRDIILAERVIDEIAKNHLTDENLKKIYDMIPETFQSPPKAHILHILKSPKDPYNFKERQMLKKELEKIRKDAVKGADFAQLAREHSDGYLKAYGGDMGWVEPQNSLPELVNNKGFTIGHMAFKLKPGGVSDVMETKYGYHIIKVVEKVPAQGTTFESARESVKNYVRDETTKRLISQLRTSKEHTIVINPSGVPERYTRNLNMALPLTAK